MTFGPVTTLTLTGASLASTAARQGTVVNVGGTFTSPVDVQVLVQLASGSTGTSATGVVNVYVASSVDGTVYTENAVGPDGAITLTVPTNATLLGQINVVANGVTYYSEMFSMLKALGSIPPYFNIILQNLSGHALGSAATVIKYIVVT